MANLQLSDLIVRDREIMSGTPVFAGTRVPVEILFDYLEGGDSLADFLDGYPSVTRENAEAVIRLVKEEILALHENTA